MTIWEEGLWGGGGGGHHVASCRDICGSHYSYNKCEEDFDTMREYNDYLEEVETISKKYMLPL